MERTTTTFETKYLRTLLALNAQEAGLIIQRFARLALGEEDVPTSERFLDYVSAEMAECAERIATYREEISEIRSKAGRSGGLKSWEARRAKQNRSKIEANEANEAKFSEISADETDGNCGFSGDKPEVEAKFEAKSEANLKQNRSKTKQTSKPKLNIPNQTESNQNIPNQTESESRGSGNSVDVSSKIPVSVSDSADAADRRAMIGEKPMKADILTLPDMALADAALRLIDEEGNRGMKARLAKSRRTLGGPLFRDLLHQYAAELEAGEVPENLGAALNARLTKAEEGAK